MDSVSSRLREGYAAYQAAVGDVYANARKASAEAAQRCSSEMLAAVGGDDAPARLSAAWLTYQQDVATLSYEHWRDVMAQQRELAETIHDAQSDAAAAALAQYVEALRAFRAGGETPSESPEKKPPAASSGQRRRTPESTG